MTPGNIVMEQRDCPVCSSRRKKSLYEQKFSTLSGSLQLAGYDVVACMDCGFAYADNIPGQDWFDSYYRDASKYTYDQRDGEESPVDKARFQSITQMITKHLPERESRILDFGCATGGLLNHLKATGYMNLLGVEKTLSSAKIAEKLYSVQIVNTSLESIARNEKPFDLLIQSGVLEHVRDIEGLLAEISLVMSRDGLMYIEVPDVVGFEECLHTPFQEFSVEHINFFSSSSLKNLLARYGFEPVEIMRLTRDYTAISRMSVLCGFFRFTGRRNDEATLDEETVPALQRYIEKSLEEERLISKKIDDLAAAKTPLIVWGVGTYTLHLMQSTRFGKLNIIAFADSNKYYQDRTLIGKPILAPAALTSYPQPILISTVAFQAEIEEQIRQKLGLTNEIITLRKPVQRESRHCQFQGKTQDAGEAEESSN